MAPLRNTCARCSIDRHPAPSLERYATRRQVLVMVGCFERRADVPYSLQK